MIVLLVKIINREIFPMGEDFGEIQNVTDNFRKRERNSNTINRQLNVVRLYYSYFSYL